MTHTPGPWRIGNKKDVEFAGAVVLESRSGNLIADCNIFPTSEEENIANARLIAEAPNLLAALIGLVEWVTLDMVEMQRGGHTVKHLAAACEFSRTAIAKAKVEKTHV